MTDLDTDVCRWPAVDQLKAMQNGELSARELLHETRTLFELLNPSVNAVVTTDFDSAEQAAAESDRRRSKGLRQRPLEGLPVAIKDLEETAGMRTTFGSLLHADKVPDRDSLVVERIRAAGAVVYGKTNTPEFGTGSHTYNKVFGTTANPYRLDLSAGGSSGGAAAALATGLVSVADGSDMGGSLRNPAAFCNVVGLRPSAGRVPNWPMTDAWETLPTNGPMARTVDDTSLLLSVLAGADPRCPISIQQPFPPAVEQLSGPLRIGWSESLGGLAIQPEITEVLDRDGRRTLEQLGHSVVGCEPDMSGADVAFRVLRGLGYANNFGDLLKEHRNELSPELVANTEYGLRLGLAHYFAASADRTRVYYRLVQLFQDIDVLAAPVTMALPFPAGDIWPKSVNEVEQDDYLDWMRASWRISLTGFAALSLPCGFTSGNLPVGLQLIAPPGKEGLLLSLARQFETARPVWRTAPTFRTSEELDSSTPS